MAPSGDTGHHSWLHLVPRWSITGGSICYHNWTSHVAPSGAILEHHRWLHLVTLWASQLAPSGTMLGHHMWPHLLPYWGITGGSICCHTWASQVYDIWIDLSEHQSYVCVRFKTGREKVTGQVRSQVKIVGQKAMIRNQERWRKGHPSRQVEKRSQGKTG